MWEFIFDSPSNGSTLANGISKHTIWFFISSVVLYALSHSSIRNNNNDKYSGKEQIHTRVCVSVLHTHTHILTKDATWRVTKTMRFTWKTITMPNNFYHHYVCTLSALMQKSLRKINVREREWTERVVARELTKAKYKRVDLHFILFRLAFVVYALRSSTLSSVFVQMNETVSTHATCNNVSCCYMYIFSAIFMFSLSPHGYFNSFVSTNFHVIFADFFCSFFSCTCFV